MTSVVLFSESGFNETKHFQISEDYIHVAPPVRVARLGKFQFQARSS